MSATLPRSVSVAHPPFLYPPGLRGKGYGTFLGISARRALERAARTRLDAVLCYWAPDSAPALKLARRYGIPSILMVGGSDICRGLDSPRRRPAILKALQQMDAIVTVSRDLAQRLGEAGIPTERTHVVYRGVDGIYFFPGRLDVARQKTGYPRTPARKLILAAGRLTECKGFDTLIESCRLLQVRQVPFECCIVGGGELGPVLRRKAQEAGLEGVVHFPGAVAHAELADWYRAADVIALPSLREGLPNVLLEAIVCGKRFVASAVGGIPEIADPRWDTLVPPGDPQLLANALEQQLSRKGPDSPRAFVPDDSKASARQLTSVIEHCLQNGFSS